MDSTDQGDSAGRGGINVPTPEEWDKSFARTRANNTVLGPSPLNECSDAFNGTAWWSEQDALTTGSVVNHPSHYAEEGKIESVDYIEERLNKEQFIGGLLFNVHKYLHRWQDKNGVEDLDKAQWYLEKLIGDLKESDSDI